MKLNLKKIKKEVKPLKKLILFKVDKFFAINLISFSLLLTFFLGSRLEIYKFIYSFHWLTVFIILIKLNLFKINISKLFILILLIIYYFLFAVDYRNINNFNIIFLKIYGLDDINKLFNADNIHLKTINVTTLLNNSFISSIFFLIFCTFLNLDKLRQLRTSPRTDFKNIFGTSSIQSLFFLVIWFFLMITYTQIYEDRSPGEILKNFRFQINKLDPNLSSFLSIFLCYCFTIRFNLKYFLCIGFLLCIVFGSRSGFLFYILIIFFELFKKIDEKKIFSIYFFLILLTFTISYFVHKYLGTIEGSFSTNPVLFHEINKKIIAIAPNQYFGDFPYRIFYLFDISNFYRFNMLGYGLINMINENFLSYLLIPNLLNSFSIHFQPHDFFLKGIMDTGLLTMIIIYWNFFELLKIETYRILIAALMFSTTFLGFMQPMLLMPIILMSVFLRLK